MFRCLFVDFYKTVNFSVVTGMYSDGRRRGNAVRVRVRSTVGVRRRRARRGARLPAAATDVRTPPH